MQKESTVKEVIKLLSQLDGNTKLYYAYNDFNSYPISITGIEIVNQSNKTTCIRFKHY